MGIKIIRIGFLTAVLCAGVLDGGVTAKAETGFSQRDAVCKVTKRGGAMMFVDSLNKEVRIRRGGTMIVVDPEPHQGLIAIRAMVNRKMQQGSIRYEDTNCVPILPR